MQKGLRVITLQGAIEKCPKLLSQYWKNELLDGTLKCIVCSTQQEISSGKVNENKDKKLSIRT